MTTNVKDMLAPHKQLTQKEITEKVKSGEIVPPKDKAEREEFFRLSTLSPVDREKEFLPDAPAEDQGKDEQGGTPPAKQWWEELGYESAEKAMESHRTLVDLTNRHQATIDGLNAKEGKRGERLKTLEQELEQLRKERDEFEKKANPPPTRPERPKRPNPKDYPDGWVDEKYLQDKEEYELQRDEYDEKLEKYLSETTNRTIDEIRTEVKKVEPKVKEEQPTELSAPWKSFWEKMASVQGEYDLKTSIPAQQISDNLVRASKGDVDAKKFIQAIPKADLDNYAKLEKVAKAAYVFTDTGPELKYSRFETVFVDHDFIGEGKLINNVKPSSLTTEEEKRLMEEQQRKTDGTASPLPAEKLSQQDQQLGATATKAEIEKRYRDLLTEYQIALNAGGYQQKAFEDSQKYTEMADLRVKLGMKPIRR
jgi:hypothetical protein